MAMNLTQLTTYPEDKARALVGFDPDRSGQLLGVALPEIAKRRAQQQHSQPDRKRRVGGGRKRLLKPYQEVLLTLVYLRHNVAFCVVGTMFAVSADVAENTFHEIVAVLRDLLSRQPLRRREALDQERTFLETRKDRPNRDRGSSRPRFLALRTRSSRSGSIQAKRSVIPSATRTDPPVTRSCCAPR